MHGKSNRPCASFITIQLAIANRIEERGGLYQTVSFYHSSLGTVACLVLLLAVCRRDRSDAGRAAGRKLRADGGLPDLPAAAPTGHPVYWNRHERIERQLGELNDQTRELVAESARAEDATACTAQLRAVMNEAAVLKEKRALIEEQRQSNAQAVRRIEDAAAAMAQASTHISEWDEALIRQLVDTVKVNSAEKITVFLRGGVQVEQDMI